MTTKALERSVDGFGVVRLEEAKKDKERTSKKPIFNDARCLLFRGL